MAPAPALRCSSPACRSAPASSEAPRPDFRPSHLPASWRLRSRACRSLWTRRAFSYSAKAPAIWRIILRLGSSLAVRSSPLAVSRRPPREISKVNRHVYVFCATIATMLFRIEWLPTLIEMTSLGEGGCDLASGDAFHSPMACYRLSPVPSHKAHGARDARWRGKMPVSISSSAVIVSDILWLCDHLSHSHRSNGQPCSSSGQAKIAQRVGVSPRQV